MRALPAFAAPETHCTGPGGAALLARYEGFARDVLNGRARNKLADYLSADFRWNDAPRGMPAGVEPMRRMFDDLFAAFPDRKVETRFVLCADDLVTVHQTVAGTNTGPLLGYPPTGKAHRLNHTEIYRFRDGRIVEMWGEGIFPMVLQPSGWTLMAPDADAPPQAACGNKC